MATSVHTEVRGHVSEAPTGGEGGTTGAVEMSLSVFLRRVLVSFFLPFLLLTVSLALAACTSEPSLIRAAKEGDTETVKTLLAAGTPVGEGFIPLRL